MVDSHNRPFTGLHPFFWIWPLYCHKSPEQLPIFIVVNSCNVWGRSQWIQELRYQLVSTSWVLMQKSKLRVPISLNKSTIIILFSSKPFYIHFGMIPSQFHCLRSNIDGWHKCRMMYNPAPVIKAEIMQWGADTYLIFKVSWHYKSKMQSGIIYFLIWSTTTWYGHLQCL